MTSLYVVVVVIGLILFDSAGRTLVHKGLACLHDVVHAGEELFHELFSKTCKWLSSGHGRGPQARDAILAFAVLMLSAAATVADYLITSRTVSVIWPWQDSTRLVALTLVLLTALVGIALHEVRTLWARLPVLAIAVVLICATGTLAYVRTAELEGLMSASSIADTPDNSNLILKDDRPGVDAPPQIPDIPSRSYSPSLLPLLAGALAILFALGETVGICFALTLGGGIPLVWICLSPFLFLMLAAWRLLAVVRMAGVATHLASVLDALLTQLGAARVALVRICRYWFPAEIRERRRLRNREQHLLWTEWANLQACQEMERVRLETAVRDYKVAIGKISNQLWQEFAEECIQTNREHLEDVKRQLGRPDPSRNPICRVTCITSSQGCRSGVGGATSPIPQCGGSNEA